MIEQVRELLQAVLTPVGGKERPIDEEWFDALTWETDASVWSLVNIDLDQAGLAFLYFANGDGLLAYWDKQHKDTLKFSGGSFEDYQPHILGFASKCRARYIAANPFYEPGHLAEFDRDAQEFWDSL